MGISGQSGACILNNVSWLRLGDLGWHGHRRPWDWGWSGQNWAVSWSWQQGRDLTQEAEGVSFLATVSKELVLPVGSDPNPAFLPALAGGP